jgi:hypothetical protein
MSGRAHSKEESRLVARVVTLLAAPIELLELACQMLLREPLGRVPFGRELRGRWCGTCGATSWFARGSSRTGCSRWSPASSRSRSSSSRCAPGSFRHN